MSVRDHGTDDAVGGSNRVDALGTFEAYAWALARLRERPKQVLVLVVLFFVTGPSLLNHGYLAGQPGTPASILWANAALWLPAVLVVQALAYRNTALVLGASDAEALSVSVALMRTLLLVGVWFVVYLGVVLAGLLVLTGVAFVGALPGPVLSIVLGLLLAIPVVMFAVPRLVGVLSATTLAFPAAVIDGGLLNALGLGWDAGHHRPYTTVGVLCVGAVPIATAEALAGEPSWHWPVLGVAIGLWLTVSSVSIARVYLQARP